MLTRRVLLGAGLAGVAVGPCGVAAAQGAGPAGPADFVVPEPACDCHQHIIGDPQRFPMLPTRSYTPGPAPLAALKALHARLGIRRAVLVQPSFYGTDNSCLLAALGQLGTVGRGIAVIDPTTSEAELDRMGAAGIRGVRVNQTGGPGDVAALGQALQATSHRVAARGWHVQAFLPLQAVAALHDTLAALPTPIVLDHFAGATAAGPGQPGFAALSSLLRTGRCYVKLSAPYHASSSPPDYPQMRPIAQALVALRPDRMLWGSDWPHTNSSVLAGRSALDVTPFYAVDNVRLFDLLAEWAGDAALRRRILVDTPAALFGF